jgi:hypothetical protein
MTSFFSPSKYFSPAEDQQKFDQSVDLDLWTYWTPESYTEGSRPKYIAKCPSAIDKNYRFLIEGHQYLYKKSFQYQPPNGTILYDQFWVEIVAYKLGRVLGVHVPPAFVAYRKTGETPSEYEYACLIEWMYNYPAGPKTHMIDGKILLPRIIDQYDVVKGKQHNFIAVDFCSRYFDIPFHIEKWCRILLFDALIGNTDRHHENWQILATVLDKETFTVDISPAFDNGTALGYNIPASKLESKKKEKNLNAYIFHSKATHHMKWQEDDEKPVKHFDLLTKMIDTYPVAKAVFVDILERDIELVFDEIHGLVEFQVHNPLYQLTKSRADFMIALLRARHKEAKQIVGLV